MTFSIINNHSDEKKGSKVRHSHGPRQSYRPIVSATTVLPVNSLRTHQPSVISHGQKISRHNSADEFLEDMNIRDFRGSTATEDHEIVLDIESQEDDDDDECDGPDEIANTSISNQMNNN